MLKRLFHVRTVFLHMHNLLLLATESESGSAVYLSWKEHFESGFSKKDTPSKFHGLLTNKGLGGILEVTGIIGFRHVIYVCCQQMDLGTATIDDMHMTKVHTKHLGLICSLIEYKSDKGCNRTI